MKRLISLIIIFGYCINIHAQDLSIELSIRWEQNNKFPLYFKEENRVPYLVIRLRNLGNKNIYFFNPFLNNNSKIPSIIGPTFHNSNYDSKAQLNKLYKKYSSSDETHFVMIGNFGHLEGSSFEILDLKNYQNDNEIEIEIPGSFRAVELYNLYQLFRLQKYFDLKNLNKQTILFNYQNKKTINRLNELSKCIIQMENTFFSNSSNKSDLSINENNLVFLKPNETKEIEFNLLGFKIIGGEYEIGLNFSRISEFSLEEKLPKQIKGFQLYQGSFLSNNLKITF